MNENPESQNRVPVAGLAVDACSARGESPTPRTDAAVNSGGYQLLNVTECSRLLERELFAFKRSNERIISEYNAAVASWDEERERALREARRVTRLLRVARDMLSTFREDDKTTLVTAERQEAWKAEIADVMTPNAEEGQEWKAVLSEKIAVAVIWGASAVVACYTGDIAALFFAFIITMFTKL